jgi:hypothetical protein
MADNPNDALWAQFKNPIVLPLVNHIGGSMRDNPALQGAATPPTLMVQLDTLGGKHFLLPLTVEAASKLVEALAVSLQLLGFPLGSELPEPPKAQ